MAAMGQSGGADGKRAEELRVLATRFGRSLDGATLSGLSRYVDLLHTWNARINLTGARTPASIIEDQLPDAFALARLVPAGIRLVDVGSGGGLPALPFALLRPDVRLTMAEPRSRRRAFLATAVRELGVRAELLAERADDLPAGTFDAAGARAVFPPGEWLERGARLVVPGGSVFLFLGADSDWQPPAGVAVAGDIRYQAGASGHRLVAALPVRG
jgi:16S rRNA (guanine527-N7)-methyltransferase